jgi:hypothetical protein
MNVGRNDVEGELFVRSALLAAFSAVPPSPTLAPHKNLFSRVRRSHGKLCCAGFVLVLAEWEKMRKFSERGEKRFVLGAGG